MHKKCDAWSTKVPLIFTEPPGTFSLIETAYNPITLFPQYLGRLTKLHHHCLFMKWQQNPMHEL